MLIDYDTIEELSKDEINEICFQQELEYCYEIKIIKELEDKKAA